MRPCAFLLRCDSGFASRVPCPTFDERFLERRTSVPACASLRGKPQLSAEAPGRRYGVVSFSHWTVRTRRRGFRSRPQVPAGSFPLSYTTIFAAGEVRRDSTFNPSCDEFHAHFFFTVENLKGLPNVFDLWPFGSSVRFFSILYVYLIFERIGYTEYHCNKKKSKVRRISKFIC